jgi:hypothetical protein
MVSPANVRYYRITQKTAGRYAVYDARKRAVGGNDKAAILIAEGLVAAPKQPLASPTNP